MADPGDRRFGLPPCIDDRAAPFAHDVVIPAPGLGIDRLADGTQQAQRRAAGASDVVVTFAHERAECGRRGVELRDLVLVDNFPYSRRGRPVGHAFVHQGRDAVRKRAVDDVAVSRDPAHVGGAPIDVTIPAIEDAFVGVAGPEEVATGRVKDALGLSGRSRGVEQEQRVFGVHRFSRTIRRYRSRSFIIPDVPTKTTIAAALKTAQIVYKNLKLAIFFLVIVPHWPAGCRGSPPTLLVKLLVRVGH